MIVFSPVPATEGVKIPVFTPGPLYWPPRGNPPCRLNGWAPRMVTVSKQVVKVTFGAALSLIMILAELAGLPVTQFRFEVMTHRTLSPAAGLKVKVGKFVPAFAPFSFH